MSLVNYSNIVDLAYTYLGYSNQGRSEDIDKLIDESIKELEEISQFKYIYIDMDYKLDFIKNNPIYEKFLEGTDHYYLVLTTLGKRVDDKVKYYSISDMKKMVVFDACSGAYLEYMADKYEKENFDDLRTYRFCPGYQGTKTSDIREIFKILKPEKIGVTLLDSNLMVPLKTMCGIIGFGAKKNKMCGNCDIKDKCEFRKKGKACY